MKWKLKKYKLIFLLIFFTTLIFACYILLSKETRVDINLLTEKRQLLEEENKQLDKTIKANETLLAQSQQLELELNRLKQSLPSEAKEDEFMTEVKELLEENELSLKKVLPEFSLQQNEVYKSLSYEFQIKGDYQSYLDFLSNLEQLDRLIRINGVQIDNGVDNLSITLNLIIYYKRADSYV